MAKDKNADAAPMTYEVQRRPNYRYQLRAAAAEGVDAVLTEPTVETTTITDAPTRGSAKKEK